MKGQDYRQGAAKSSRGCDFRKPCWMEAAMGLFKLSHGNVGVNLGGFQFRVAEHFLDQANVTAGFQQQGGKAVPKEMARAALANAGCADDFSDLGTQPSRSHPPAFGVQEQGRFVHGGQEPGPGFY